MSLHAILEVIRSSGEARIKEIEGRAYAQAREIMANARLEAEAIKEQARIKSLEPAARERARLIHRARLEALQITGNVRETLIDSALEQTRGRLAGFRSDPIYPQVLRRILQEALAELETSQPAGEAERLEKTGFLEADRRDRQILEDLLDEMGLDLPVKYHLECWGGLIARSQDGRVVVINTLEARLERATPYLRRYWATLIENRQPEKSMESVLEEQPAL